MPKDTYYNLSHSKQKSILKAIQGVIIDKPIPKISVADMVKAADIPRGSFYQYFEDLEDVFGYVIDVSLSTFEDEIMSRIQAKPIGFFDYLGEAIEKDFVFFANSAHQKIIRKFFDPNQTSSLNLDRYAKRREAFYDRFIELLDLHEVQHLSPLRIKRIYYYLSHVKLKLIQQVLSGRISFESAKEEFTWLLKVFRKGIKETNTDA